LLVLGSTSLFQFGHGRFSRYVFHFLRSVRHRRGTVDLGITAQHGVESPGPDVQMHILQAERYVITCSPRVLPQPQEEEKDNSNHIRNGVGVFGTRNAVCLRKDVDDDNNRDWFDSFGQRVVPLVGPDLSLDPEIDIPVDVFSDIRGPTRANAWQIARSASSTIRARTVLLWGAIWPPR
jgi:hypothetical protein